MHKELENNIKSEELSGKLPIILDSLTDEILTQKIAIPYVTARTTTTPRKNGYREIFFDGTDYYWRFYANGGWREILMANPFKISGQVQGDVVYFNGTSWTRLAAGTSGQFLKTQGSGANPLWDDTSNDQTASAHTSQTTSVANDNTDTVIRSLSIPAMGANDVLYISANFDLNVNSQNNDLVKLKVGANTLHQFPWSGGGSPTANFVLHMIIFNRNSASSQYLMYFGRPHFTATFNNNEATAAVDLSSAFTLDLTYLIPVANSSKNATVYVFSARLFKA